MERQVSFFYDGFGRLTETHFPDVTRLDGVQQSNVKTVNVYSLSGRRQLLQAINEENHATTFSLFHTIHGLPQTVLRDGGTDPEVTHYDVMGNVFETRRPQGGAGNVMPGFTVYGLDGLYRVRAVTDAGGFITTNGYDLDSHLVSVQPPAGLPTTSTYDRRGFVSGGATPDGSWSQLLDANGNIRLKSSLRGFLTKTEYDGLDRISQVIVPGGSTQNGLGGGGPDGVTRWDHDGFDGAEHFTLETREKTLQDRVTKTVFDNRHRPIRAIAPDGITVTETFYDTQDHAVATQTLFSGALQTATLTFRDVRDRVERMRVQDSSYPSGTPNNFADTIILLNKVGSVVQTIDPLGSPTSAGYAHKTTNALDARERVDTVIDGLGNLVKKNIWGDDDLLIEAQVPDPATKATTLVRSEFRTYTARKELKSTRNRPTDLNSNGVVLDYIYNAIRGQVNTVTDAQARVTKTTYNANTQRVDEVIVAQGTLKERSTRSVWDKGLLTQSVVWNPSPTGGGYNATYSYFYDQGDRLERFVAPLVSDERHFYNECGEESKFIAGPNKTIEHFYNALGQRTSSIWSGAFTKTETRVYNEIGLVAAVDNGTFRKEMLYDNWNGTPAVETFRVGGAAWKIQTHHSDKGKNYVSLLDGENKLHEWVYDENNRVTAIKYSNQVVSEISYTIGSLIDKTVLHDATAAAIAETTHRYDGLGRKISQETVKLSTHEAVASFEWTYDSLDLVTGIKVNHLGVKADLQYNERRELTQEAWSSNNAGQNAPLPDPTVLGGPGTVNQSAPSNEASGQLRTALAVTALTKTYDYDPAGNRTVMVVGALSTAYTYNSGSQLETELSTETKVTHHFDPWGNETDRSTETPPGSAGVAELYGYNYLNLMSTYQKGNVQWQYDFWPSGERYSKTHSGAPADTELYIPRFGDVVTEYTDPNTLKNRYVQGAGLDAKCTRISPNGDRRHYLGDSVGTVSVTLTDTSTPSEITLRDVWGVQLSTGPSSERYGFAQREQDNESGLVQMRARMYDPKGGRFTQTDPTRSRRASAHYVFASNDPIRRIDPTGQKDEFKDFLDQVEKLGINVGELRQVQSTTLRWEDKSNNKYGSSGNLGAKRT